MDIILWAVMCSLLSNWLMNNPKFDLITINLLLSAILKKLLMDCIN